jgi:hypothetical protein
MPYKDPAKRAKAQAEWKKRSYTPAYMKWLYARRKLSVEKMTLYEEALEQVGGEEWAFAQNVLKKARTLERKVGNRFDHENDKPYYKEGE